MNCTFQKRALRILVLTIIGVAIGVGMGWLQTYDKTSGTPIGIAGTQIGGPFTLVDQTGQTVSDKDFAGKYVLMYFGFTSCPAICPTELLKMVKALRILEDRAKEITPVFITVDPERDTPEVMKAYVTQFDKRLIGLTGTQPQIDAVLRAYRIYASKVKTPSLTDYTVDHSSFIYFMGPDGMLISLYRTEDTAEFMAKDIAEKM